MENTGEKAADVGAERTVDPATSDRESHEEPGKGTEMTAAAVSTLQTNQDEDMEEPEPPLEPEVQDDTAGEPAPIQPVMPTMSLRSVTFTDGNTSIRVDVHKCLPSANYPGSGVKFVWPVKQNQSSFLRTKASLRKANYTPTQSSRVAGTDQNCAARAFNDFLTWLDRVRPKSGIMAGYLLPAPAILRRMAPQQTSSASTYMEADAPFASHCGGVYAILGVRDTSNIILTSYIGVSRQVSQRIVSHATSIISKRHDVTISGTGQQFVHAGIVQLGVVPRDVLLARSDDADELKRLEAFFVFAMGTFNHTGWQQLRTHFTRAPGPLLAEINLSPCTEHTHSSSRAPIPSAMSLRIRYNRFRAQQRTMFAEDAGTFHAAQRELRELRQDEERLVLRHGTLAVSAVGSSPTSARVIYLKVGDIGLPAAVEVALLTSLSRIGHNRLATVVSIPRGQKDKTLGDAREATNPMPSKADHLILGLSVTRDGSTFERLTTIKPELTRLGLIVTLELDGRTSAAPLQFAHNEHNSSSYLPDLADFVWSSLFQSAQASRLQMRSATSTERHNLLRSSISPFAKTLVNGKIITTWSS
ncbi:hypothetical protein OC861_006745 [Tilletia horrida]|nr:hypothetical protein OC861_006745 [Tilletia horrida]